MRFAVHLIRELMIDAPTQRAVEKISRFLLHVCVGSYQNEVGRCVLSPGFPITLQIVSCE